MRPIKEKKRRINFAEERNAERWKIGKVIFGQPQNTFSVHVGICLQVSTSPDELYCKGRAKMEYILIVKFPAVLLFYYITHINKQASESVQYMGTTRPHIFFFYTIAWSFQDNM